MALASIALKTTPTVSITAGTSVATAVLSNNGQKAVLYATADTDYRTRRTFEFSKKEPKALASAPNGYSQPREVCLLKFPRLLANGKISVDTMRIEMATDVETSDANKDVMLDFALEILASADGRAFFKTQSTT